MLGVSRMTVWRWVQAGRLPVARLGHRTARIRVEDIDRLIAAAMPAADEHSAFSNWRQMGPAEHLVQFYEADTALVDATGEYISQGLKSGDGVLAIATGAHRADIESWLRAAGHDVDGARDNGQYVELDAAETLARLLVDEQPDRGRFVEVISPIIEQASEGRPSVRAFGEMVALLAAEGNHVAAVQLETFWNILRQVYDFSLLCAYPLGALNGAAFSSVFGDICAEHAGVIPAESYTTLETPQAHTREIARLQQRAAALEAEMAARERLETAALRLAAIVESSDDAIIGKTLEGVIVDWNRGAQRLYGYDASEVVGRPISVLIPEDRPDELPAILSRLKRGERIDHYETERVTKDGRRLNVSVTISPIRNSAGQLIGASAIARDISERRRQESEREALLERERQARAEAESALRLRDEFLSIASHELRTPLATLKGYSQLAARRLNRVGQLEPEQVLDSLQAITTQSDKLDRLLGQLLDVSRLELGKLALEPQHCDVAELVEQVVRGARARDEEQTITFSADLAEPAEVDPLRLEQVVTNLLDNAIKYSPDGGAIDVTVSRAACDMLEIRVRDHGLGIPPDKRAQIFERFFQAHGDGHKQGMGLGLFVSRQIVELHGGNITAESPTDGGTCFIVRLPLAHSTSSQSCH